MLATILHVIRAYDRLRLRIACARHPGLTIAPSASTNLATAEFHLEPGARLEIGPDVETDRRRGGLRFFVEAGASVKIGRGSWLRSHLHPTIVAAFGEATIEIGEHVWLSGCHLSAKQSLIVGRESMIGMGTRVFDSDQHDRDTEHHEITQPVTIGDHVWITTDVTVLKGVTIGSQCVIGTRSVVTTSLPPHTLAVGIPARPVGKVGDRTTQPHV